MRFSKAYIPTTKEAPSDAVLASHIYLARAGFMTQVASGLYNFLPLGKRVLSKIESIIKEEMDACDAQEVELSFVTPAELWQESGRIEKFGKELLRFKDRKENLFVLGPTNEEMMVNLVRNRVTSYKQLPLNLYQIKTKFRDEARPRFGLMRGREFLMKDGYSFHVDEADLEREFNTMEAAYKRILERLGLDYRVVEADSGAIGGNGSKELMVIADSGEDTLVICEACEYGANVEAASRSPRRDIPLAPSLQQEKVHTPAISSIDALAEFFKVDPYYTLKAVAKRAIYEDSNEIVLFFLRGCDELQEVKAANAVDALDIEDVSEEDLLDLGLVPGFMGPQNLENVTVIFDTGLEGAEQLICGANEMDYHLSGFAVESLNDVKFTALYEAKAGDGCPHCDAQLTTTKGIEVGHIFKLGTTYSKVLKAEFLNDKGQATPFVMGTYGMGVSRLVASVIEQHHDEKGCIWTKESAPYLVNVMVSNIKNEAQVQAGELLYTKLRTTGVDVILDDRKERFGFKMKDAELIGFPFTVIIGKELDNGMVQIMNRATLEKIDVKVEEIYETLMDLIS